MTSKDLATYVGIEANTNDGKETKFESEPDDDQLAYEEILAKRGYLTEHESVYFASRGVQVPEDIPIRYSVE